MDLKSKELKAFLNANKAPTRLLGALERYIISRPADTSRRIDILHPSEIVKDGWCHRFSYYVLRGELTPKKDRPGLRLQSIFDEGHSIHHKWQSWITEMGALYGRWWSEQDKKSVWAVSSDPVLSTSTYDYKEVPLEYPPLHIAGHSDGWVVGLGDDFLIEIKSIGTGTIRMEQPSLLNEGLDAAWKNLRSPFRSHIRQGMLYLHLCHLMERDGLLKRPAPKEIVFIYELKLDQSYKEFAIDYDVEPIQDILIGLDIIAAAMSSGIPPECNVGPKGCKNCLSAEGEIS